MVAERGRERERERERDAWLPRPPDGGERKRERESLFFLFLFSPPPPITKHDNTILDFFEREQTVHLWTRAEREGERGGRV